MGIFDISGRLQRIKFSSLSDSELSIFIKQGNKNAFSVFYERYKVDAYNYALSILKNKGKAMDATHDSFIKLYENRSIHKDEMNLKAYFFKMIRNRCFDILKKKTEVLVDEQEHLEHSQNEDEVFDKVIRSMTLSSIDDEFYKLDTEQRDIFLLYVKGFSMKEISKISDLNENSVKTKISRIKKKIIKKMEES
jgi:RNA polymerase sigma-70 factor (ECF subfamily)